MVGVANRPGGYSHEQARFLEPLLGVCAQMAEFCRSERLRQEMERQMQLTKEAAEAANRANREFLANVSHELRTPLTSIIGFADVLQENSESMEAVDAARTIKHSGRQLLELANQMLDLAKIEAGRLALELAPRSLGVVVDEAATLVPAAGSERVAASR
jgi:signal transduction histidine kinase